MKPTTIIPGTTALSKTLSALRKWPLLMILFTGPLCTYAQESVKGIIEYLSKENEVDSESVAQWGKVKTISIYGGGSLLGAVTADDEAAEASSVSGSLGINFTTYAMIWNVFFSYNGRSTIEMNDLSDFGSSLMNPNLAGQSLSLTGKYKLRGEKFGVSLKAQVADNLWQLDSTTTLDASPFIVKIGFFLSPFIFTPEGKKNKMDMIFDVHYTHRSIFGDFSNGERIVGGHNIIQRGYNGVDVSVNILLNSLHMYVQYSRNLKEEFTIPGFTGSQVVIGLNVTGDFIDLAPVK